MKKNYRLIKECCDHCQSIFMRQEYDEGNQFYCNIDNDRPLCCSTLMNEASHGDGKYIKELRIWEKWAEKHRVLEIGICDEFAEKQSLVNSIRKQLEEK